MPDSNPDWSAFYEALQRYVRARVRGAADADDLVQVILERALAKEARRSASGSAAGWLFGIARNAIHDHYRAQKKVGSVPDDLSGTHEESALLDDTDRAFALACMDPLLRSLPADTRQLLRWADIEERPLQRIAQELGISLTAAKSRVQRARAELRKTTRRCCAVTVDARRRVTALVPRRDASSRCSACFSGVRASNEERAHDC